MKSKASYSNAYRALMLENARRFWPIPVVGFLIYFLSGVFPILLNYNKLEDISAYIDMSLANQHPFFMASHLLLPVVAAVVIFRYLHSVGSASVMHAMPFTRPVLFSGNVLSGLLLTISPVLLNGLILLLIAKPVYVMKDEPATDEYIEVAVNVFSRLSIVNWMAISILIILFTFAIAVLAGIVTGNSLMHFAAALGFNFLIPALYMILLTYFETYLYGFTISGAAEEFLMSLSPFFQIFQSENGFPLWLCAVYLIIAPAIFALGLFLYKERPLERCGDSLVFRFLEPAICFLIAFFSMTLFGLYFSYLNDSNLYRYSSYIAGALIGLLLGQMLVHKTIRVFHLASLKRVAIYGVIAVLFFCGLNFDVTGYETRLPNQKEIASAGLDQDFIFADNSQNSQYSPVRRSYWPNSFKQKDNISLILSLQKKIVEDKQLNDSSVSWMNRSRLEITYTLEDGKTFTRRYNVPLATLRGYTEFAPLFESAEFLTPPEFSMLPASDFNYIFLKQIQNSTISGVPSAVPTINDKEDMYSLAQALTKDLTVRTFGNMTRYSVPLCSIELGYNTSRLLPDKKISTQPQAQNFDIYPDYKYTLAWLKSHDYQSYTRPLTDQARYLVIAPIKSALPEGYENSSYDIAFPTFDPDEPAPVSDKNRLVLTNPIEMNAVFANCETRQIDNALGYLVFVTYPDSASEASANSVNTYYLNADNLPEIVEDYFD